jgi:hypothetical protein
MDSKTMATFENKRSKLQGFSEEFKTDEEIGHKTGLTR